MHEIIQAYFDEIYHPFKMEIEQSQTFRNNETYGEIYYYSVLKLLKEIHISDQDHFLDIGSGLGKLVFQLYLTTKAASVTGVEINQVRHQVACEVKKTIENQLPKMFNESRKLTLLNEDFLKSTLDNITIIYLCATIFSFDLLSNIGKKINEMETVQWIVSFRKLPHLTHYKIVKKIFLHCTWDHVACYLYRRKS